MVKTLLKSIVRFLRETYFNFRSNNWIFIYNDWRINQDAHYFKSFIEKRGLQPAKKRIAILGPYNTYPLIAIYGSPCTYKIFYTPENVHVPSSAFEKSQSLYLLNSQVDISIGFDYVHHSKYVRYPFWLLRYLSPTATYGDVVSMIQTFERNWNKQTEKVKFCSFVCRKDYFGDRTKLADEVEKIAPLCYAGLFRHNDDDLKTIYNDDKICYLQNIKFSLCPENSNADGYVTEKLFDAFSAGCIPIYWGSNNNPEPGILNPNVVIYVTPGGDNRLALKKIKELNDDIDAYMTFKNQSIFTPEAPQIIWNMVLELENKIKSIVK